MSVKTSKARELLERFSTSLQKTIEESNDVEKIRRYQEQQKISKTNQEAARNTALLMNVMRLM